MVRVLSLASLGLAAVSAVSGLVVPRLSPPKGWETDILEVCPPFGSLELFSRVVSQPYGRYHERYLALHCQDKHGQPFFDQCCHPLLATQKLESRPPQCIPDDCDDDDDTSSASGPTKPTPTPTHVSPQPKHSPEPSTSTSSTPKPSPSTSSTPKPSPSTSSTPKPSPTPSPATHISDSSDINTGGQATFFYQKGVAGACGAVHSDSDFICAIDADRYGNTSARSGLCGKQVKITNTKNGKTVTVTIADACPTCKNGNSIDLSVAAFEAIAPLGDGIAPIEWTFV
ncbi:plant expansin [Lactarius psammicola]|nr:plant expansin [Lactarius psammicola]